MNLFTYLNLDVIYLILDKIDDQSLKDLLLTNKNINKIVNEFIIRNNINLKLSKNEIHTFNVGDIIRELNRYNDKKIPYIISNSGSYPDIIYMKSVPIIDDINIIKYESVKIFQIFTISFKKMSTFYFITLNYYNIYDNYGDAKYIITWQDRFNENSYDEILKNSGVDFKEAYEKFIKYGLDELFAIV